MLDFLFKKPVEYSRPPVLTSTSTQRKEGFRWYESWVDYKEIRELTTHVSGRVAVLDDTAKVTNDYLIGSVDVIYDFTLEKGLSSYHGHHVGGIISSKKHGLFPTAKIGMFKVLSANSGKGTSAWLVKGIQAAEQEKYEVINASLGSKFEDRGVKNAVLDYCKHPKHFLVAATGNDGSNTDSPASLCTVSKGVIAVGAAAVEHNNLIIPTFSNYGKVSIVAPAVDIVSTFPDNREETLSGTSMATPFIAGLIATCKAINPNFNHDTLHDLLSKFSHSIEGFPPEHQGKGFVMIKDIIKAVSTMHIDEPIKIPTKKSWCKFLT